MRENKDDLPESSEGGRSPESKVTGTGNNRRSSSLGAEYQPEGKVSGGRDNTRFRSDDPTTPPGDDSDRLLDRGNIRSYRKRGFGSSRPGWKGSRRDEQGADYDGGQHRGHYQRQHNANGNGNWRDDRRREYSDNNGGHYRSHRGGSHRGQRHYSHGNHRHHPGDNNYADGNRYDYNRYSGRERHHDDDDNRGNLRYGHGSHRRSSNYSHDRSHDRSSRDRRHGGGGNGGNRYDRYQGQRQEQFRNYGSGHSTTGGRDYSRRPRKQFGARRPTRPGQATRHGFAAKHDNYRRVKNYELKTDTDTANETAKLSDVTSVIASPPAPVPESTDGVRTLPVSRLLAEMTGLGSRRKIGEMLESGQMTVNGQNMNAGHHMLRNEIKEVVLNGQKVAITSDPEEEPALRVLMYHKGVHELCSRFDMRGRKLVFRNLPQVHGRWISVGRLDYMTSGLLICTNNGELAQRLMHPSHEIPREYRVRVAGRVSQDTIDKMLQGIEIEEEVYRFDQVSLLNDDEDAQEGVNSTIDVVLHTGRNREVRRLLEEIGFQVIRLRRTRFGDFRLPENSTPGNAHELSIEEKNLLLKSVGMNPIDC